MQGHLSPQWKSSPGRRICVTSPSCHGKICFLTIARASWPDVRVGVLYVSKSSIGKVARQCFHWSGRWKPTKYAVFIWCRWRAVVVIAARCSRAYRPVLILPFVHTADDFSAVHVLKCQILLLKFGWQRLSAIWWLVSRCQTSRQRVNVFRRFCASR